MRVFTIDVNNGRKKTTAVTVLIALTVIASLVVKGIVGIAREHLYAGVSATPKNTVIIVDAGHGGEDSGAIGINGVYEKDLNLIFSFLIGEELEKNEVTVVYTRSEDKLLYTPQQDIKGLRKISDLKNRQEIAEKYEDPIFISIHMNSYGAEKYSGLQVYYSPNSVGSYQLAQKIQTRVKNELQPQNNRKIKNGDNIYLMKNIQTDAVLIECGFLTNREECKKLSEKEYQKQLSFSIVCGIIEYINETRLN